MHQRSSVGEGRSLRNSIDVTNQRKAKVHRHGGHSSVVEHSTANREVPGSNQGVVFFREVKRNIYLRIPNAGMICPVLKISNQITFLSIPMKAKQMLADAGVYLSGRTFDCRSRSHRFKPRCPLQGSEEKYFF
ncbi:hypothetical protein TNCV_728211 [Trichonephila clavipes]|nr:hypothetical protein TNCV_728211 [Trichonephila clavipes]